MEESWEVCMAHMEQITETIGNVIADGAASGEFEVADVPVAALCACTAMMRFFHPQMIAQCAEKPGPSLDQMIDFVLAGLARKRSGGLSSVIASGAKQSIWRSITKYGLLRRYRSSQ